MDVTVEDKGKVQVLSVNGRLDSSSAKKFKAAFEPLAKTGHVCFVINLSDVEFIDSAGLGVMVSALRKVNKKGGDVKLAEPRDSVRMLLELTRLHQVFDIYDGLSDAVEAFA